MTKRQQRQWLKEQFEFEYCSECGGGRTQNHIVCAGPFGLPFAKCTTVVVFRVWVGEDGGDVIALFHTSKDAQNHCDSYMHVGGHGSADYHGSG